MSGLRIEQLTKAADMPGACWMVVNKDGVNVGVVERAGPYRFSAHRNGSYLGAFTSVEVASDYLLALQNDGAGR